MVDIFAKRAVKGLFFRKKKMKYDEIFNYIDGIVKKKNDWYLDAQEAVDYGFADGILGTKGFETFEALRE
jgi:ATP-dependent protease ClpP protease subunit